MDPGLKNASEIGLALCTCNSLGKVKAAANMSETFSED